MKIILFRNNFDTVFLNQEVNVYSEMQLFLVENGSFRSNPHVL